MAEVIKAEQLKGAEARRLAVLKLTDLAREAREVVLEARKEAARIVGEANCNADGICRHAREHGYAEGRARGEHEGYVEGLRRGRQEAREQSAAKSAELTSVAKAVLQQLAADREELLDQGKQQMLEFSLALAGAIVGQVAVTDISAAKASLARALQLARRRPEMKVLVNPDQFAPLREHLPKLVETLAVEGGVQLAADERISRGGAKLTSRHGEIDATIESQLRNVAAALLGQRRGTREQGAYVPSRSTKRQAVRSKT